MRNTAGLGVNQVMFPVWQIHHTNTVALKGGTLLSKDTGEAHCTVFATFPGFRNSSSMKFIGNDIENNLRGEEGRLRNY